MHKMCMEKDVERRIALVMMPFASVGFPAIGVSLLQAGLRRAGFACDVFYWNVKYAADLGIERYHLLSELPIIALVGDWVFAAEVFENTEERDTLYRTEVLINQLAGEYGIAPLLAAGVARDRAAGFLDRCLGQVDWSRYLMVGFSTTFEQNVASLALARRMKNKFPEVHIAFGGANCEGDMGLEIHRKFPFVDFVCSGEGDVNLPELVRRLDAGKPTEGIDGIIVRREGSSMLPPRPVLPVTDMDSLPTPSYNDYFEQIAAVGLQGRFDRLVPFESARGCWWGAKMHCTFCGLNGTTMAYRSKSPERVLEELDKLSVYGKDFVVVDNILDLKYLETLFPEIARRQPGYTFHYETKVNLKKHQLKSLRDAGITDLQPGIESFSTSTLRLMRKGCTMLQNIEFLKWCREFDIRPTWNLLYGFPGEDLTDYPGMAALIPSLLHLHAPDYCVRMRADRFSPYFNRPKDFGFTSVRPHRSYSYVYPFEESVLLNLAYFFETDHPQFASLHEDVCPLVEAAKRWQDEGGGRYLLFAEVENGFLLADNRSRDWQLTEISAKEGELYRFCDESRALHTIREHFSLASPEEHEWLQSTLDRLLEQRLMVREGERYLALAVPSTVAAIDVLISGAEREAIPRSAWLSWQARSAGTT